METKILTKYGVTERLLLDLEKFHSELKRDEIANYYPILAKNLDRICLTTSERNNTLQRLIKYLLKHLLKLRTFLYNCELNKNKFTDFVKELYELIDVIQYPITFMDYDPSPIETFGEIYMDIYCAYKEDIRTLYPYFTESEKVYDTTTKR